MAISREEMAIIRMCNRPTLHITKGALVGLSDMGFMSGSDKSSKHYELVWEPEGLDEYSLNPCIIKKGKLVDCNGRVYASLEPTDVWNTYTPPVMRPIAAPMDGQTAELIVRVMSNLASACETAKLEVMETHIRICDNLAIDRRYIPIASYNASNEIAIIAKPIYGQLGYMIGKEKTYVLEGYRGIIGTFSTLRFNMPPTSNLTMSWSGKLTPWEILARFATDEAGLYSLYFTKDEIVATSRKHAIYVRKGA